jgi:tRNA splicing endonuclease
MDHSNDRNYSASDKGRHDKGGFDESSSRPMYDEALDSRVINAESLQTDTTLNDISKELRPGETLVLDIGNNYFEQTDEIYDTLVMRGYDVRKSFKNGRNQILVSRSPHRHPPEKSR